MNPQLLLNTAVIVVLIAYMGLRQLNWRPVDVAALWRGPAILAAIGVFTLAKSTDLASISTFDVCVLVFEIVVSLGVGSAMGAIARFRPLTDQGRAMLKKGGAATLESRTGWWGFALWIVFIAVRIGIDVGAGALGSQIAASTGVILLLFAANRAARSAVISARVGRLTTASIS